MVGALCHVVAKFVVQGACVLAKLPWQRVRDCGLQSASGHTEWQKAQGTRRHVRAERGKGPQGRGAGLSLAARKAKTRY